MPLSRDHIQLLLLYEQSSRQDMLYIVGDLHMWEVGNAPWAVDM